MIQKLKDAITKHAEAHAVTISIENVRMLIFCNVKIKNDLIKSIKLIVVSIEVSIVVDKLLQPYLWIKKNIHRQHIRSNHLEIFDTNEHMDICVPVLHNIYIYIYYD